MSYNHFRCVRHKDADEIAIYHTDGTYILNIRYATDWSYIKSPKDNLRLQSVNGYPMIDLEDGDNIAIRLKSGKKLIFYEEATAFANIKYENSGGQLFLKECTTPTALANYGALYTKADNKLYFQDGAGAEHEIGFA